MVQTDKVGSAHHDLLPDLILADLERSVQHTVQCSGDRIVVRNGQVRDCFAPCFLVGLKMSAGICNTERMNVRSRRIG